MRIESENQIENQTPEITTATLLRRDISNLLDLQGVTVSGQFYELSDLNNQDLLDSYFNEHDILEISNEISRILLQVLSHAGDNFEIFKQVFSKIDNIHESFKPDYSSLISYYLGEKSIKLEKRVKSLAQIADFLGTKIKLSADSLSFLVMEEPLKSYVEKGQTKKGTAFLDEIGDLALIKIVNTYLNYSIEETTDSVKLDEQDRVKILQDFNQWIEKNKDPHYSITGVKEWPNDIPSEIRDFIINDVWKYWKDNKKLPTNHRLDLSQKGKVIEIMLTELFDTYKAFGAKNIFPTAPTDDEKKTGAHADLIIEMEGENLGIDIYSNYETLNTEKKYRNMGTHNPRTVEKWPPGQRPKDQNDKRMIVLPIQVNSHKIIEAFKLYYENYKNSQKLLGTSNLTSYKQTEQSNPKIEFKGFKREIAQLLISYKEHLRYSQRTNVSNQEELLSRINRLLNRFFLSEVGNNDFVIPTAKQGINYLAHRDRYN